MQDELVETAEDMEAQAIVLLTGPFPLSDKERIAEAANYITCAAFLRARAALTQGKD